MKYLIIVFFFVSSIAFGQLSMKAAKDTIAKSHIGSYSYQEQFIGHEGYAAPIILTADGGAAAFGDYEDKQGKCGLILKLGKNGKAQWKLIIRPQFTEVESQSVVQDINGNYYVFMLSYDSKKYRGGCERIVCINKIGKIVWDKIIGSCDLINNPTISYGHALKDGRIALRGHIATKSPATGKDPEYLYWEGWINSQGVFTQKTGDVIDWSNQDWQKLLKPE